MIFNRFLLVFMSGIGAYHYIDKNFKEKLLHRRVNDDLYRSLLDFNRVADKVANNIMKTIKDNRA